MSDAVCKHDVQSWPLLPTQTECASGGPTCLRSENWSLRFYRVPPLTPCAVIAWSLHTTAQRLGPETSRAQQNKKLQAEGKVSADTDTATYTLVFGKILRVITLINLVIIFTMNRSIFRYIKCPEMSIKVIQIAHLSNQ